MWFICIFLWSLCGCCLFVVILWVCHCVFVIILASHCFRSLCSHCVSLCPCFESCCCYFVSLWIVSSLFVVIWLPNKNQHKTVSDLGAPWAPLPVAPLGNPVMTIWWGYLIHGFPGTAETSHLCRVLVTQPLLLLFNNLTVLQWSLEIDWSICR